MVSCGLHPQQALSISVGAFARHIVFVISYSHGVLISMYSSGNTLAAPMLFDCILLVCVLCVAGKGSGKSAGPAAADEAQQPAAKRVEEMDLDEFLDGGFEAAAAAAGGSDSGSEEDAPSSDLASDDADLDDVISDGDDVMAAGQAGGSDDDESEDVSEDEEGDAAAGGAEGAAVAADNKRLKGAVARHKQQLEALKEKDPEFYAYLQVRPQQLCNYMYGTS